MAASKMLAVYFFNPLLFKPGGDLEIADDQCPGPFGDSNGITNVVAMSMADEDEVWRHSIRGGGSGGITAEEGINNQLVASSFEAKSGMSVPDEFIAHFFLLTNSLFTV